MVEHDNQRQPDRERGERVPQPTNVLSVAQTEKIFPGVTSFEYGAGARQVDRRVILGTPIEIGERRAALTLTPVNSTLGLFELTQVQDTEKQFGVIGNTVQRLCPEGNCADHAGHAQSHADRLAANCATANTQEAFLQAGQEDSRGSFMMLPTSDNVIMLGEDEGAVTPFKVTDEHGEQQVAFNKLGSARAVIFGEEWAKEQDMDTLTAGINGADSTFGTMSLSVDDENFVVAFCTTRENLGDRPPEFQVLRKAVERILDAKGITGEERAEQLAGLDVRIDLIASATLENFAHDIKVPPPGSKAARELAEHLDMSDEEYERKYAITSEAESGNEDINARDGITPSNVMDWQYPAALENGFVYGESDVALGLEPRGPEGCPGFGEKCHIDYRGITKDSIVKQLTAMGIGAERIGWHDEQAVDPADPDNNFASNRREQLAGVPVAKTDRTFNGVNIAFTAA